MMSLNEFAEQMVQDVSKKLESEEFHDLECKVVSNVKKNNCDRCGIGIGTNGVGAVLYVDEAYQHYMTGASYEEILEKTANQFRQALEDNNFGNINEVVKIITDYEKVKEGLLITLVGIKGNEEMLENHPHRVIEDMAVTYRIMGDVFGMADGSVPVSNGLLEKWGITEEQLHEDAVQNSVKNFPAEFRGLFECLGGLCEGMSASEEAYVANTMYNYGASVILYPGFLEGIAERFNTDLIILPSSIHDCIIIPCNEEKVKKGATPLLKMVKEINATQVAPEDRLTDNVYFYDRESKKFGVMS